MRRTFVLILAMLLSLVAGCHPQEAAFGRLSDSVVVAAGKDGGGIASRPQPLAGAPLGALFSPSERCVPGERWLELLGPVCDHETENRAPPVTVDPTADLPPGKPPRALEVRWYCDARLTVRVVLAACDANSDGKDDGLSPVEIGVAIREKKE